MVKLEEIQINDTNIGDKGVCLLFNSFLKNNNYLKKFAFI